MIGYEFIFLCVVVRFTSGANILGVFTSTSRSHIIIHKAVADALIDAGHNLTIVSSESLPGNQNFQSILLSEKEETKAAKEEYLSKVLTSNGVKSFLENNIGAISMLSKHQMEVTFSKKLHRILSENSFDLVIIGYFFNDFQLVIPAQLRVPVIVSWLAAPTNVVNSFVGNANDQSYVPSVFLAEDANVMGFRRRIGNFLITTAFYVVEKILNYKFGNYYNEYVQEFNLKDMPSFDDMRKNVSLVFCNSHFSEGPIRPNVPAIVEIGGIQIKDKPDPLEPKLKEFLDNSSKHGAILFSMGSNVKVSTLDPKIIKTLYNVFSKLKQNVLWKWEDPNPASFPGNSKNILFSKWIPQDDVLAHKNMKLFVTHGGKGSVVESQYHGIPMIGLPVFGDQPGNIDKIVKVGYGLKLDYKTMTEQELSTAVNEVLNNPSYAANVKKFADTYKDRPLSARESVVFWTEYVIRHHGAPHLQSPLVHMNVIQQYSIDVLAVIFGALYIVYRISKLCICFVWRKVFGKKCKSKAKAKKSKKE
ncbi:hypothetical protein ACFFRR_010948 [Megaselia abdita]